MKKAIYCFLLIFFLPVAALAAHEHYTAEVSRLTTSGGLIYNKAFRSTADAQDGYQSNDGIPFGSTGAAYYDGTLDGTVLPMVYNLTVDGISYSKTGGYFARLGAVGNVGRPELC